MVAFTALILAGCASGATVNGIEAAKAERPPAIAALTDFWPHVAPKDLTIQVLSTAHFTGCDDDHSAAGYIIEAILGRVDDPVEQAASAVGPLADDGWKQTSTQPQLLKFDKGDRHLTIDAPTGAKTMTYILTGPCHKVTSQEMNDLGRIPQDHPLEDAGLARNPPH